ncbi:type II toxin-antitoxin system RelE/ParE family toxin [uncultured Mucilaginibacter sp.]|uniref:type II toxin-antitoxin system RelE family toxin n=1 Tax=uncultured Mucilaginibacter sp. TaxID=797541 RepID=UPI0025E065A9|nr:type II toxin-antitoxin system RelE/ParE family toxin [uncultured Mucilaginibacter sp.]
MSYSFILKREASLEFSDAYVWYEEQQEGLGEFFNAMVEEKLKKICKNPFHYKISYKKFHEALTDKFPFLIVYFIDEQNKLIVVTAIFHTSRNPKKKFKRTTLK